jgi:protein-S-isoprenylcysteine O-methyltransferase Ste14
MTTMQGLNIAKVTTIVGLVLPALVLQLSSLRLTVYLTLHIAYCVWWLLEQWLFPERGRQLFTERLGPVGLVLVVLYVGIFYCLPGWLAMANPAALGSTALVGGLLLYIYGSLINTAADVQKGTAKTLGATLVRDGIWRRLRHVNYLGDLLRYASFAVIAGSPWAWLLPASVLLLYVPRILSKEQAMQRKYPGYAAYEAASWRLLPGLW